MTKFTDNLWSDLTREHHAALAQTGRPGPSRIRRPRARRPRVIAGSTLALAAIAAVITLGLTSTGSTTTGGNRVVTDAYTITQNSSGSVLVTINNKESINAANAKLNAMIKEQVVLRMGSGPAPVKGPVACTPGVSNQQGPPVKVLLGTDGTQVIAPGTTGDNTGVGTWYVTACHVYPTADMGTGGTGVGKSARG
jgi:hypothetical protein